MRSARLIIGGLIGVTTFAFGQIKDGVFSLRVDHPAIQYSDRDTSDPITKLYGKLQEGKVHLKFEGDQGYLRSVLEVLNVPIESQIVVFSKTSVQAPRINPHNPRVLYFNDSVTVGWVRGGFVELAVQGPEQGVIFYTLHKGDEQKPVFMREDTCLACHVSRSTMGVPGMLVRSVFTAVDGMPLRQLGEHISDHRSPLQERWGGWYVTGRHISALHMGNAMVNLDKPDSMEGKTTVTPESLTGKFDTDAYLSPYSDIVALMVFEHQTHMINLLTRVGWEARYSSYRQHMSKMALSETPSRFHDPDVPKLNDTVKELVDYLLFIDEAPLASKIEGTSGFTKKFSGQGPKDRKGRSFRQFDLQHRLMRYPCSYMIYSEAFDALPGEVKQAIYKRMWQILSRQERGGKYARFSFSDRRAVVEILRETKIGLPTYFHELMPD